MGVDCSYLCSLRPCLSHAFLFWGDLVVSTQAAAHSRTHGRLLATCPDTLLAEAPRACSKRASFYGVLKGRCPQAFAFVLLG